MKVYQLSKNHLTNTYWWTGTCNSNKVPDESYDYKWTTDKSVVDSLNGQKFN